MMRVVIHVSELAEPVVASVAPGHALLLGRAPDPTRLPPSLPVDRARLATLRIASEKVSSTHALILGEPDGLTVVDLDSRNGSAVRLLAHRPLFLRSNEFVVELASRSDIGALDHPEAPRWTHAEEFAERLRESASRWLDALGAAIELSVEATPSGDDALSLPLATGAALRVRSPMGATADLRSPAILESLARFVAEQNALIEQERGHDPDFILRAPRARDAHQRVFDAAVRGRRLLLLGASGTGKDRLASCYHLHSARRDGPFRALNCALMDKELIWVQLFGASRGSFTGSVREVVGAVELAHRGTLFLDEVGELSPRMQAALLRFLDRKGEFERLGEQRVRHADVQVVCATNANLRAAVSRGEFREDLWYRFAGSVVEVPSLRDRPEDVDAYLSVARHPGVCTARELLSGGAMEVLRAYPWPGNFRELENFVARLPLSSVPAAVDRATCEALLREGSVQSTDTVITRDTPRPTPWDAISQEALRAFREDHDGRAPGAYQELREFFEAYLRAVYVAHAAGIAGGSASVEVINHSAIGRQLGIADGSTVRRCLERYVERFSRR